MKTSAFFTVAALYSVLMGISFLFFPDQYGAQFGVTQLDNIHRLLSRYFADANLGLALTWFLSRNITAPAALRALLAGSTAAYGIGVVISVLSFINNVIPVSMSDFVLRCGILGWSLWCLWAVRKPNFAVR